jgi:chromate reductase, NAD(P)H dehydrogenase (quinone)
MDDSKDIAVLVGSLRQDSVNRKMALALRALAPAPLKLDLVEIGHLPFYNQELDADGSAGAEAYRPFRQRIARADGVLFVTPEYNRTIPAVVKNAIDIGSRPYGKSVWSGKSAGVISVSMGALGGFGANQDLRRLLANVDMPTMQQPEAYIANGGGLFDEGGAIAVDATRAFLTQYLTSFAAWTRRHAA